MSINPQILVSNLTNRFQTGNLLADTLITTAFLASVTWITSRLNRLWLDFTQVKLPNTHSITIEMYCYLDSRSSVYNRYYKTVTWYLSKFYHSSNGHILAYSPEYACHIANDTTLLAENHRAKILFNDQIITYYIQSSKKRINDSDIDCKSIVLEHNGPNGDILREFLQECQRKYDESLYKQGWQQNLYQITIENLSPTWYSSKTYSKKSLDNIVLPGTMRDKLRKDIDSFINGEDLYNTLGVTWKRGYMFYGRPGCGKSSLISAISNYVSMDIYKINLALLKDDKELTQIFRSIPKKSIIAFEDIDCNLDLVHSREFSVDSQNELTLSCLLNELDGIGDQHGRIVIITTNNANILDEALIRSGRIDFNLELNLCDNEMINQFLDLFYPDSDKDVTINIPRFTLSPADVSSTLLAHRDDIKAGRDELHNLAKKKEKQKK